VGWSPDLLPSGYFAYCGCDPVANATINLEVLQFLLDFEIVDGEQGNQSSLVFGPKSD